MSLRRATRAAVTTLMRDARGGASVARELSVARRGTSAGATTTTTRSMQLSAFDGDKRGKRALTPEEQRREAEQMEELSVFRAVGGLVAAAAGGGLVFVLGAGAVAATASGLASALSFGTEARAKREENERREALRAELSAIDGWGFEARRRRREVRAKLATLGEAE